MQLVTLDGLDLSVVADLVGAATYARGVRLAHRRSVRHLEWSDTENGLWALLQDEDGRSHEACVYFASRGGAGLEFVFGECTCAAGADCQHVVAVVVTAAGMPGPGTPVTAPVGWEQGLTELLAPPGATGRGYDVALGIELSLHMPAPVGPPGMRPEPRLLARLVRPGRSGWVGGNLTWSQLDASYRIGDCDPAQVGLLREIHALHRARAGGPGRHGYYYAHTDKTIDLASFGSRRLFSLLQDAPDVGLAIVHARKHLGLLEPPGRAELCLDVTAGAAPDSLVITPRLRVDDTEQDPSPVLFLGAEGHGVVWVPRAERDDEPDPARWPFRLAELSSPAPPALQRMVLEHRPLAIPAGQQDAFASRFYPQLRHLAEIESSDGAFTPPAISEPTLVLRADYGEGHDLELDWEWAYDVGGTAVRAPLTPPGPAEGFRDPAREKAVLDALPLTRAEGRRLAGMDTVRFSTEVLPLLADAPGVAIETSGSPARYREAGDAVRIGVSTGEVPGESDWFDLGVTITVENQAVPFATVFAALATDEPYLLLPDGAYFSLHKPELQALRTLIEEARALQDTTRGPLRISRFQAGLWEELAALGVVDQQARAWEQQVGGLLALDDLGPTELPATLCAQLRPYQRSGFDWLCFLWRHRLGGILADDMGLGKTLQTLALICHAKLTDPAAPPFLVVAPTSVVPNWAAEAARFAPGLSVVVLTDTLRKRGRELDELIAGADVVVTSYTLFRLDADAHDAQDWSGLILDEAQFAKNHQSQVHQRARRLPAPFKLAITGTPMENNLMELWSLISITAPGLFPSPARFKEAYARPIEKRSDAELLARLRRRIRPLMRRRTKEQVAPDLPSKQVQRLDVDLDPRHRRIYERHLQRERQKILGLIADVDRNRFTILRSLTLLRQLSLHPGLIEPEHDALGSAKIDALSEQLSEVIRGGHRALVFSQFTGFLGRVRDRLDADGIAYSYLDGSTRDRPGAISRFTDGDVPVFLISLKAGGFGLNLTGADYCFLLDPWWNPATEAQAIDRTHRIGQTRNVMVYRLIARDTIEEKVAALADRKAQLFRGVMDDGDVFGSTLDADDIRELLG